MNIEFVATYENGVLKPDRQLPLQDGQKVQLLAMTNMTPSELRRLPREQRQGILAAAAKLAEQDYNSDKNLTAFDAFSEEEVDDAESGTN
jgi:predicted DNA-binding antitoxin AbrB/MazE fold protein